MRNITGPSGQAALFITCADAGVCYELAGRHCPQGYDLRAAKVDENSVVVTCNQPTPSHALHDPPTQPAVYPAYASSTYDAPPPPMVSDPWQAGHAPPPAPPPPPSDQASQMASPRPIGAGGPDLGY